MGHYQWDRLVAKARKLDDIEYIWEEVHRTPEHRVREWVVDLLKAEFRRSARAEVVMIEREVCRHTKAEDRAAEKRKEARTRRNSPEAQMERDYWEQRRSESLAQIIRKFQEEMKIEWTRELLNSSISMPDGRTTTWGEATQEDHQERAEMFKKNALANLEGAVRHEKALEVLAETGALNLNEAMSGKAA